MDSAAQKYVYGSSTVLAISRAKLIQFCIAFGPTVNVRNCVDNLGAPLIGTRLLLALAGRESSFGKNLLPRHESSWDLNGSVWKKSADLQAYIARWGSAGACSYGPLQVMAFNATGFTPVELAEDPETAMTAAIGFFNRYVIGHWQARTLAEISNTWNCGHPSGPALAGYVEDVTRYYHGEPLQ